MLTFNAGGGETFLKNETLKRDMLTVNIVMIILCTSYVLLAWLYYISYTLFIMYTRVHSVLHYIIIIIIATVSIRRTYSNYNWQVCTIYYSRVRYIVYVYNVFIRVVILLYTYTFVFTLYTTWTRNDLWRAYIPIIPVLTMGIYNFNWPAVGRTTTVCIRRHLHTPCPEA
jgi:hypothetical protein